MMITLSEEESNRQFVNFSEMERNILDIVMQAGRDLIRQTLEQMDVQILESRDKVRYRSKGLRSTSVASGFFFLKIRKAGVPRIKPTAIEDRKTRTL